MKKSLLVLVFAFLLGPSLCAQTPDWDKFPGAKEILDNMEASATSEPLIPLEDAIKNNPNIYSEANVRQLVNVAGLKDTQLSKASDYLLKVHQIILKLIYMDDWSYASINDLAAFLDNTEEIVKRRPLVDLVVRLENHGVVSPYKRIKDYINYVSPSMTFPELVTPIIKQALLFYGSKKELTSDDIADIIGTTTDEFKDGLLNQADEITKQNSNEQMYEHTPRMDLRLRVLCDKNVTAQVLEAIGIPGFGKNLGKSLIDGVVPQYFGLDNSELEKIVGQEGMNEGVENLYKITSLIEKK